MNDTKYGRLYPERAVAPLRALAEEAVETYRSCHPAGDTPAAARWEKALKALDSDGFPPDEPLFLLRGQDELAHSCVRSYRELVGGASEAFGGGDHRQEVMEYLLEFAKRMERWEPRKMPD